MNSLTDFFENYVITVGQGSNMVQSISVSDGEVFFVLTRGAITIPIENALAIAVDTDEDGVPMDIKIVLYKVKFGPFSFSQSPSYKEGLAVSFEGDALLSDKDELGATFADGYGARIGKIIAVSL